MHKGFIHKTYEGMEYLVSPLLEGEGVRHCFTTRLGGYSKDHLESLNLGLGRGDDEEALRKNYEKVALALGFNIENLSVTKQVHETHSAYIKAPRLRSEGCDALFTDKCGIPLMSYSADCIPVLMYDKKKKAAATVHSGWRGTAAKICAAVISDMKNELGTDPGDLICAIGPSIGPCCFQIKSDAVEVFLKNFENTDFIRPEGDNVHYKADIWEAVCRTLKEAGVRDENIDLAAECSCCNDIYFSCRRQKGRFGAMGAFIEL